MFKTTKSIKGQKHFIKLKSKEINIWLIEHGITKKEAKVLVEFAHENIILKVFLNLISLEGKNKNHFINEMIHIILYSRLLYTNLDAAETKQIKIEKLKITKIIETILPSIQSNVDFKINYEKELFNRIKTFSNFSDEIINKRKHFYYSEIGKIFSKISDDKADAFYKYGYLLSMYIITYFESDFEEKINTYNNFLFKLELNDLLCETTKDISPFYFNSIISKLNNWLTSKSKMFRFKEGAW
ncbi:unknown protein [Mesoplasma florum L1]|uniref:Uncharacterized protein n=1 Tax=Mesoplasma florum (strain ATCC 33453 / NBRC 100688 / NCTC 11704 / L1) TaxID=265311 RepID=Q6F0I9_MESFL|nr:hypothetical protein [Mesoplasma florum]AAT75984.1 unknown protein [Mesoplasma florum L1]ATI73584.1 hypothetical protein CQZ69_03415 [Mesoplasma florum]ATI74274.1 hypothetical protein CQZ70_03445 [Mesoplasma florum]AVN59232.1 hypothetical protein CG009_03345 [Mesoplasma florum]AVN61280.1 hypothetical protein CG005_03265 [Mesoplasma florum]